jgi:hypothetical protein
VKGFVSNLANKNAGERESSLTFQLVRFWSGLAKFYVGHNDFAKKNTSLISFN